MPLISADPTVVAEFRIISEQVRKFDGRLCMAPDFIKAMCFGADVVALANSDIQAGGCVGACKCNTNNRPGGIATQNPEMRSRIDVSASAERLASLLGLNKSRGCPR